MLSMSCSFDLRPCFHLALPAVSKPLAFVRAVIGAISICNANFSERVQTARVTASLVLLKANFLAMKLVPNTSRSPLPPQNDQLIQLAASELDLFGPKGGQPLAGGS